MPERPTRPAPTTSAERRAYTAWTARVVGELPGKVALTSEPREPARVIRGPLRSWLNRVHGVPAATREEHENNPPPGFPSGTRLLLALWRDREACEAYVGAYGNLATLEDIHQTEAATPENPAPVTHRIPPRRDFNPSRVFDADPLPADRDPVPVDPWADQPKRAEPPRVTATLDLSQHQTPAASADTAQALAALLATLAPKPAAAIDEVARDVANRAAGDAHQAQALAVEAQRAAEAAATRAEEAAKGAARPAVIYTPGAPPRTLAAAHRHALFPAALAIAASSARTGRALMLVGPAGSGKTTAAQQIAEAMGRTYYEQGACTGAHDLLGFVDGHGRYSSTPFRAAFEGGGLILLDEIDASDAAALLIINSAVANGRMPFPDQTTPVARHADFIMVASANTYGTGADRQYVGRAQLDAATLDRFTRLAWSYDEKLELALTPLPEAALLVQATRAAIPPGAPVIVSPRASFAVSDLTTTAAHIMAPADLLGAALWAGIPRQTLEAIQANRGARDALRAYEAAHAKAADALRLEATKATTLLQDAA